MLSVGLDLPNSASRKRSAENSNVKNSPPHKFRVDSHLPTIGPHSAQPELRSQHNFGNLTEYRGNDDIVELSSGSAAIVDVSKVGKCDFDKHHSDHPTTAVETRSPGKAEHSIIHNTTRRVFGPAPPPLSWSDSNNRSISSSADLGKDESSDSDNDYGPSLPSTQNSKAQSGFIEEKVIEEITYDISTSSKPSKSNELKRAEWMITPPTSFELTSRIDTTKLKNRKFTSGKNAKGQFRRSDVSSLWTETSEEKRRRLEDEVLGRRETASSPSSTKGAVYCSDYTRNSQNEKKRAAMKEQIREFNEKNRNKSLLDERKAAQDRGEIERLQQDDPSQRAFDKEKDMSHSIRPVGNAGRKQLLKRITDFGDRFQEGNYL